MIICKPNRQSRNGFSAISGSILSYAEICSNGPAKKAFRHMTHRCCCLLRCDQRSLTQFHPSSIKAISCQNLQQLMHHDGLQRESAKAFLKNMAGGFKAKVADPSRQVYARSRTMLTAKRMRPTESGSAPSKSPSKEARLDLGATPRRATSDEDVVQEGEIDISNPGFQGISVVYKACQEPSIWQLSPVPHFQATTMVSLACKSRECTQEGERACTSQPGC